MREAVQFGARQGTNVTDNAAGAKAETQLTIKALQALFDDLDMEVFGA